VIFWVVASYSLVVGNRRFGGRAASIFRVEVLDQVDASTALLPTQRGCENLELRFSNDAVDAPT
jgi:hypothetical protein